MSEVVELPSGWQKTTLGEVCSFQGGTQPPLSTFSNEPREGFVRLLQIRDFENDRNATYVNTKYNLRIVKESDVLMARYGASVGKILTGKAGAINVALMRTVPDEKVFDKKFLYNFLLREQVTLYLQNLGGRSAQAGFNQGDLNRIEIFLPPLPEQRAIAEILGAVQAALGARRREHQLEQEHKAALLEQLFTRGTSGEVTRETEIGELPVGWGVGKLGDVCVKTKQRNPTKTPKEPFRYVDVSSVSNVSFEITSTTELLGAEAPSRARKIIRENDTVLATVRPTLKRIALVPASLDDQICSTGFCVLQANSKMLVPAFLFQYLLTAPVVKTLGELQKGALYPAVSDGQVFDLQIPLPPLPEQQRIAAVLGALDAKLSALAAEVARLEELFRALLEELLSGRLRVPTEPNSATKRLEK